MTNQQLRRMNKMFVAKGKEQFLKEIKKRFPMDDIELIEYSGASKPITYMCKRCKRQYSKTRANHLYENKTLCLFCNSPHDSKIRKWIINFLKETKKFKLIEWHGNTGERIKLQCLDCGSIFDKKPPNLFQRTENTICPICGDNGCPITYEIFLSRLEEEKRKEYQFFDYINLKTSMKIKHKCGFVYSQLPLNFIKSKGCPKCNKKISIGEKAILDFLEEREIPYERNKTFKEIGKCSFDFFVPEKNLLIEFQGKQHYEPVKYFGGEEKFKVQQERDKIKKDFALKNNFSFLEIRYDEIQNIENILSGFLAQRLNVASSEAKMKASIIDEDIV